MVRNIEVLYEDASNDSFTTSTQLAIAGYVVGDKEFVYQDSILEGEGKNIIDVSAGGMDQIATTYLPVNPQAKVKVISKIYGEDKRVDEVSVTSGGTTKTYYFTYNRLVELAKKNMTAEADSQFSTSGTTGDGPASWAIDGKLETWWHNNYSSSKSDEKSYPYTMTISLSKDDSLVDLSKIQLTTRANQLNKLKDYKLFYSEDGVNFKNVFAPEEVSNTYSMSDTNKKTFERNLTNTIEFKGIKAKKIRLVMYSSYQHGGEDTTAANIAEMNFYAKKEDTLAKDKKFAGWFDEFGSKVEDFSTSKTVYAHWSNGLTIGVENGKFANTNVLQEQYFYNEKVTVVADSTQDANQKFSGWYVGDTLVSTKETYSFYAYKDMKLSARYVAVSTAVPTLPAGIFMDHVELIPNSNGTYSVRFIGHINTESEEAIAQTGFVYTGRNKETLGDEGITVESAKNNPLLRDFSFQRANYAKQFSVTVVNIPANKLVRGKFYIKTESGATFTYAYSGVGQQETHM